MKTNVGMDLLYKAILSLETENECKKFLEDLCTPQELQSIAQRLKVAEMLRNGEKYNSIVDETSASTATISRVNKTLTYQTAGGYEIVFERLKDSK